MWHIQDPTPDKVRGGETRETGAQQLVSLIGHFRSAALHVGQVHAYNWASYSRQITREAWRR
jgi:hypothetical protein